MSPVRDERILCKFLSALAGLDRVATRKTPPLKRRTIVRRPYGLWSTGPHPNLVLKSFNGAPFLHDSAFTVRRRDEA